MFWFQTAFKQHEFACANKKAANTIFFSHSRVVLFQGDLSASEHERRLVLHQQQRAHYYHRVCK